MLKHRRRVLFITHDDSRTGAPILLVNLCKCIQANDASIDIDFLIKQDRGEIASTIHSIAHYTYTLKFQVPRVGLMKRAFQKMMPATKNLVLQQLEQLPWTSYDFVLSNTITNGDILGMIRSLYRGKIVSYIHELEMATETFTNQEHIANLLSATDIYAYPSLAVKNFLQERFAVAESQLNFLPYYIASETSVSKASVKDELTFVVGGCGTPDWRKGADLFIQVALLYKHIYPTNKIRFEWKGVKDDMETKRFLYDIKKAGLEGYVIARKADAKMPAFWQSIDLFLLTSREDPFPLVMLEAAQFEVPTLTFTKSGGSSEFVVEGAGATVAYLNVHAMVDKVATYANDRERLRKEGCRSKERVNEIFGNAGKVVSSFEEIAKQTIL